MRKPHTACRLPLKTRFAALPTLRLPSDYRVPLRRHQYLGGLDIRLDTDQRAVGQRFGSEK
jgi:hypothetical protein